jgi:putative SOS response-associated peptidase YedK
VCGRYASSANPDDLVEEFEVDDVDPTVSARATSPDFNVAPTKDVFAVLERVHDDTLVRRLRLVRWGLVPSWAKDLAIGNRMINARAESLTEKPAYRRAFSRRRCILPADGYYEWRASPVKGGRKQPFFIQRRDGQRLAMAGIYEIWRNAEVPEDAEGAFVWSASIITRPANADTEYIHDRMPALLREDEWSWWLDPRADAVELPAPTAAGVLEAYPVSTAVNNVRNNGAELLRALPPEEVIGADGH